MAKPKINAVLREAASVIVIIFGTALTAFALMCLLKPKHMMPGGIATLSAMIADITPISIGVWMILFNVPVFLLGFKIKRSFFIKSLVGTLAYSAFANVFSVIPTANYDPILHAVFGGVFMGTGLGLVLLAGGSTGGTDIFGIVLHRKMPQIKTGRAILIFDIIIITVQSLVYKSVEAGMFAAVAMFLSSKVIDYMAEGFVQSCKTVYIISQKYTQISSEIMANLGRGVTALEGSGMYTGDEKKVLLCTFDIKQLPMLKRIIASIDSNAFVFFSDAKEVSGNGFN